MSRKAMTTTLNQELIKKAKKLAIDRNKNLNDLIEEGLMIILNKYAPSDSPVGVQRVQKELRL
jgi:hypothetical protein